MFRKTVSLVLAAIAITLCAGRVSAASQNGDAAQVAKVKSAVAKRGVGENANIRVKLHDKTEVKGYVYQTGDDNFVVADKKTGAKTTVAYSNVQEVKGKGLSTGWKIAIVVGVVLVVVGIVIAAAASSLDEPFGK
ncbi:MAG TPA: hypothetical protein VFV34_18830 [Blastocatellia bacterium]|nr:hypothetical protein [Blastocatellia bacterium]